jgi:hypothetical protein
LFSPTYLWRPLDSRFARLEARLVRNKEWLEKELGRTETKYATAEKGRAKYREFLDKRSEAGESEELGQQRMAKRSLLFPSMCRGLILMLCSEKDRSYQDVAG